MRLSPGTEDLSQFDANNSNDMLGDSEELLNHLSTELGLHDIIDGATVKMETDSLYDQLIDSNDDIFSDILHPGGILVKPKSDPSYLPPSPSNSDHSDSSHKSLFPSSRDSPHSSPSPLSPPYSPNNNCSDAANTSTNKISLTEQPIVKIPDMSNAKLPIPKVSKPSHTRNNNQIFLTSAQLAQLTQNGLLGSTTTTVKPVSTESVGPSSVVTIPATVLKTQASPQPQPLIIKTEPVIPNSPMVTGLPTVHTLPLQTGQGSSDIDLKTLKRQQRMIKNRESACLSRKKKKEYVSSLEEEIGTLKKENQELRNENSILRVKLRELESEKFLWTDTVLNRSSSKRGTVLLVVLFVVILNFNSMSGLYQRNLASSNENSKFENGPLSAHVHKGYDSHVGRSLLWATDNTATSTSAPPPNNMTSPPPICPVFFNQSESLRLDSQLRGWFQVDPMKITPSREKFEGVAQKKLKKPLKKRTQPSMGPSSTSLGHYGNKPSVHSLTGGIYHMLINDHQASNYKESKNSQVESQSGLTLYDSNIPRFTYEAFFEAIDRKDDHFYVVSFSGDHLLLPASAHNQTSRPRMSLLLPTMTSSLNDSMKVPANHVAMMQIDCEVMNTRLIYIKDDAIPMHMNVNRPVNESLFQGNSSGRHNSFGNQQETQGYVDHELKEYALRQKMHNDVDLRMGYTQSAGYEERKDIRKNAKVKKNVKPRKFQRKIK